MAVVIVTNLPAQATRSMEEAVAELLAVDVDPPDGMILHSASETDHGISIIDVWESEDSYRQFEIERLNPAIAKITGAAPADGGLPIERQIMEPYRVHAGASPSERNLVGEQAGARRAT